jgi:ketosteroid isomerase-like protein
MLLLASDVEFARIARTDGFAAATSTFVADGAVLLPMNHPAVYGRDDIAGFFAGTEQMLFSWTPADGEVGASCDIGTTFGAWSVQDEGGPVTGKYLAAWRFDGTSWKVVTLMHNADAASGTPEDDEGGQVEDGTGGEEPNQPDS